MTSSARASVSALFRDIPGRSKGTVVSIAPATLAQPATASAGTDPAAPRLHPDQFVAVAVFDNADGSLSPGMAGKAKIQGRRVASSRGAWRVLSAGPRRRLVARSPKENAPPKRGVGSLGVETR